MSRIGIYAGTFDPVHAGHVAFGLQALQLTELDRVYFLPERRPRGKRQVEHFAHRVAMLRRAVAPHPQFGVLELVDVSFSVERTLPRLRQEFPDDQLVFLFGSDVVPGLAAWPHVDRLLASTELVIGLRAREKDDARDNGDIYSDSDIRDNNVYIGDQHIREDHDRLRQIIEAWPTPPQVLTMFPSYAPDVSSGRVREALRHGQPGQPVKGLLSSVERYSDRHWLYVSLA